MYLTRAFLNPRRSRTVQFLANPQLTHAAVLGGFSEQPVPPPDPKQPRILWRLDTDNPHKLVLWLASPEKPDLTHIVEQAGWPYAEQPQWITKSCEPLYESLAKHSRYAFRLTANPTHAIRSSVRDGQGRRVAHSTPVHQIRWLEERAPQWGFRVCASNIQPGDDNTALDLQIRGHEKITFPRRTAGEFRNVTLLKITYDGHLEITDPQLMRISVTCGLGPGRAYGCGLLTLAPALGRIRSQPGLSSSDL